MVPTSFQTGPGQGGHPTGVVRIPPELALAAACRLVSQSNPNVETAAKRLVASAPEHGIDLSLIWGTVEPKQGRKAAKVRQACLAVLGAGRTAMLFVSEPAPGGDFGDPVRALGERIGAIEAACTHLGRERGDRVAIAQALPDPAEAWSVEAFQGARFIKVGDLSYLRREGAPVARGVGAAKRLSVAQVESGVTLEPGLTVHRLCDLDEPDSNNVLLEALERSYIDTLDCPELCGLRARRRTCWRPTATRASLIRARGGCCFWRAARTGALFSNCPELHSAELVYLGLSPQLRGRGLGRLMLSKGIDEVHRQHPTWAMTLAVDHRNGPAAASVRVAGVPGLRRAAWRLVKPVSRKS